MLTFEIELDLPEDSPIPTKTDIENWVRRGMERDGFPDGDVIVAQL